MIIPMSKVDNRKEPWEDHGHSGGNVDVEGSYWYFGYRKEGKSQMNEKQQQQQQTNSQSFEPPKILRKYRSSDDNMGKHKV